MSPTRKWPGGLLAAALVTAVATACRTNGPTSPVLQEHPTPSLAISDGSHGGNHHFYFLSPLVPEARVSGTFDGTLSPTVKLCELVGRTCEPVVGSFSGPDITVSEEAYQAVWYTRNSRLDESKTYRIQVFLRNLLLGFADVDIVDNGIGKDELDPDHVVIEKGTTLPIGFRIEAGLLDGYFVALCAGGSHSCGLTLVGHAYCWGENVADELGDGNAPTVSQTPVSVLGGHTFSSITAGHHQTCGLNAGGVAYCWGWNSAGELGDGNGGTDSDIPVLVSGGHSFQAISAGHRHGCGVTPVGVAWCWGDNNPGQLGDGNGPISTTTPVKVVFP